MLPDKIKVKLLRNIRNNSTSQKEILKSHMSADEIAIHPVIGDLTKKIKRIKFDSLINVKPKLTPIKDIKDEKKIKLIENVNSFRKILYEYNKNQKYPKKDEINIYKGQKKYNFYEKYKIIKKNASLGEKQMLEEIKTIYRNKDIDAPSITKNDNNLFNGNLLLLNGKNINNSILYQLTSEKSNKKSISYLKKIYNKINNQILGKPPLPKVTKIIEGNNNSNANKEVSKEVKDKNKSEKIYYNNANKEEISKSQNYINSIKETINTMDDIDYFFDSNNKDYFNYLKNPSSKISTRVNSALGIFPLTKTNMNNNAQMSAINIYDLKNNFKFNNQDTNKSNKSSLDIFRINLNNERFSNFKDNNKNNEKSNKVINFKNEDKIISNTVKNNRNNSVDNLGHIEFSRNPNLMKIRKINLNRKIDKSSTCLKLNSNSTSNKKNPNLKVQIIERPVARKRSSINYNQVNITLEKLSSNFPIERRKSLPYIHGAKPINEPKSVVENIYVKIKDKDDTLEYDFLIRNYLENRKYNLEAKLSPSDVCNNYQIVRENIVRNDFLKRNMKLKKISGFDNTSSFEKMTSIYEKNKNKIHSVADEMNKVFANLKNPVLENYSGV